MDLLNRIQRWYTINCNGDWEHSYGTSITNVDNPGWCVTIDLQETCLEKAVLPKQPIQERSPTNWVSWHIENHKFIAYGGPQNLSEILSYFLDILLPQQGDRTFEYEVYIPLQQYQGLIWRLATAYLVTESQLCIVNFPDPNSSNSYITGSEEAFEPFRQLEAASFTSATAIAKEGDIIEATIQEHQFGTALVYAGHTAS